MIRKLRITVEGKAYDVAVEILDDGNYQVSQPSPAPSAPPSRPAPAHVPVAAPAPAPKPASTTATAADGDIISPLAGKVVSVDCKVGDSVSAGQQVMTLEAMKMNTFVNAPKDGTIKSINVQPGDGVEEGQSLISMG